MSRFVREAYKYVGLGTTANPVTVAGSQVYPQKNNWACGPWSLRHCLLKLGIDLDPYDLAEMCRSTRAGTTEKQLELGAYLAGGRLRVVDVESAAEAKRQIHRLLHKGWPLVLSVDKEQHWVACLHASARGYLVFDSSRPGPVIQLWSWYKLKKRLRFVDKRGVVHYCVLPVQRPK
jgi:ABC-type bacteriocin/lantibiotic exporter with double-glycine peptidase domain